MGPRTSKSARIRKRREEFKRPRKSSLCKKQIYMHIKMV